MTQLHVLPDNKPKYEVKIDLDERAFLFPSGKPVIQLTIQADGKRIHVDAVSPSTRRARRRAFAR